MGIDQDATLQARQEAFRFAFGRMRRFSWPTELKQDYFRKLNLEFQIKRGFLPLGILDSPEPGDILAAAIKYDTSLALFSVWHKRFESLGVKEIGVYRLRGVSNTDWSRVQAGKPATVELAATKEWQLSAVEHHGDVSEFMYTRTAQKARPVAIDFRSLDQQTQTAIREGARSKGQADDVILEVKVIVTSARRTVVLVRFDKAKETIEVAADNFQSDDDGNRLGRRGVEADTLEVLNTLVVALGLSGQAQQKVIAARLDPVLDEAVAECLSATNSHDLLVVHRAERFEQDDVSEDRLSLRVEADLYKQRPAELEKEVAGYFDREGTFEGFLAGHPHWNSANAPTIEYMHSKGARQVGFRATAWTVAVRPAHELDGARSEGYTGHMRGKRVESVSIAVSPELGTIEVGNGQYSEQAQRTLLDEIHKLAE